MTKQNFIEHLKGTKVYVAGKGNEIVERLLELCFSWDEETDKKDNAAYPFLYVSREGMKFTFGDNMEYFQLDESKEIPAEYILDTMFCDFNPFDRVLVRDHPEDAWRCDLFSHTDDNDPNPFYCVGNIWKDCIPFEGNEHLMGTTDKP